jgi:hypothetical protein
MESTSEKGREERKRLWQVTPLRKPPFKPAEDDPPYIKERLGPFISFFETAYLKDRSNESRLLYPIIIFGALIAVINVFSVGLEVTPFWIAIFSSILGALISIFTGINQFEKYHQRWIHSKQVAAKLRNQYYLWKYRVGDIYACDPKDNSACKDTSYKIDRLVSVCEEIILKEAAEYADMFTERRGVAAEQQTDKGSPNDLQERP